MASLTATVDAAYASIKLTADLASLVPKPDLIRITRKNNVTLETVTVRGADPVYSPGGIAYGYDHEVPLGVSVTYTAQGYTHANVATGAASTATLTSPNVAAPQLAWVKSVANPSLSKALTVTVIGPLTRPRRREQFSVLGRTNKVVNDLGLTGREGPLEVAAMTAADINACNLLFAESTVLIQFDPTLLVPDLFASFGDINPLPVGPRRQYVQKWGTDVIEVDRPATAGSQLKTPAWSWTTVAATWASWTATAAARTSWIDLADG